MIKTRRTDSVMCDFSIENLKIPIFSFSEIFRFKEKLTNLAGIYSFLWNGDKNLIKDANLKFVLKGSKNKEHESKYWTYGDPVFLYIGKSTNFYKRFLLHRRPSAKSGHQLFKGIKELFPEECNEKLIQTINENVYISHIKIESPVERFYEENKAIGKFRPWFNVDCER